MQNWNLLKPSPPPCHTTLNHNMTDPTLNQCNGKVDCKPRMGRTSVCLNKVWLLSLLLPSILVIPNKRLKMITKFFKAPIIGLQIYNCCYVVKQPQIHGPPLVLFFFHLWKLQVINFIESTLHDVFVYKAEAFTYFFLA